MFFVCRFFFFMLFYESMAAGRVEFFASVKLQSGYVH